MTDAPQDFSLAAEFPAASHEQWRKLAEGVLEPAEIERHMVTVADLLTDGPGRVKDRPRRLRRQRPRGALQG